MMGSTRKKLQEPGTVPIKRGRQAERCSAALVRELEQAPLWAGTSPPGVHSGDIWWAEWLISAGKGQSSFSPSLFSSLLSPSLPPSCQKHCCVASCSSKLELPALGWGWGAPPALLAAVPLNSQQDWYPKRCWLLSLSESPMLRKPPGKIEAAHFALPVSSEHSGMPWQRDPWTGFLWPQSGKDHGVGRLYPPWSVLVDLPLPRYLLFTVPWPSAGVVGIQESHSQVTTAAVRDGPCKRFCSIHS